MDFEIPKDIREFLEKVDAFIEAEIKPLEQENDNIRFLDYRREDSRTDWDRGGLPNHEWELLMAEARRRADAAGLYRYSWPKEYGGQEGSNLGMAIIREHLAAKGLGLHCDLQTEHAVVGNSLGLQLMGKYGTDEQKAEWLPKMADMEGGFAFGITELNHGTDATYMETRAYRDGDEWVINGNKTWNTGLHAATHDLIFARTSGEPGQPRGITAFIVPTDTPGFKVEEFLWTFNMPTDHATISLTNVRVHKSTIFGGLDDSLSVMQSFVNENRIRQAASSLGAAQYCIDEAVKYARERRPVRQGPRHQPGHPVSPGRAADSVRDAAGPGPQDGVGDRHLRRIRGIGQGVDVQLLGQPPLLRSRRPGHAGPRRPGLLPEQAVRAHLPSPSPLPDHRGLGGAADAPGGRISVRLHGPAQGRHQRGGHGQEVTTGTADDRSRPRRQARPGLGRRVHSRARRPTPAPS